MSCSTLSYRPNRMTRSGESVYEPCNQQVNPNSNCSVLCFSFARSFGQDAKLQLANLDKLSEKAARVTDVTLDGSLLQFAVNLIEKVDAEDKDVEQLQSIIKNLKGIYIKSFEF